MTEKIKLDFSGKESIIYEELAKSLDPYKETVVFSNEFVVEGTIENPIISIRYPGKKLRKLTPRRKNSAAFANLFDFYVVIYNGGKEDTSFTFENMLNDFEENKKDNDDFWHLIKELYFNNRLIQEPPLLNGINSKIFLLALKWIWIQEDFNYKLGDKEVNSPTPFNLMNKKGKKMSKGGAGRAKFFAALILLKNGFSLKEVKKIIPMYA